MKNAQGGDSQKCTIALYPKKLGQRGLWFEGGSVMVLMWEAGWVNIPDGRGTDNDEGRAREESQNHG